MKVISTIKLGKFNEYKIETEGDNLFECIYELGGVHNISHCPFCEGEYLFLKAIKTDEDYEYLKVTCGKCYSSLTFGKTKKDNIMYYRRKDGKLDWEKYEPKTNNEKLADSIKPEDEAPF